MIFRKHRRQRGRMELSLVHQIIIQFIWQAARRSLEPNSMSASRRHSSLYCDPTTLPSVWCVSVCPRVIHLTQNHLYYLPLSLLYLHLCSFYRDSLYNTNAAFDWGPLRLLTQDQKLPKSAHSLFSMSFNDPGVYVFKLSSHHHRHMVLTSLVSLITDPIKFIFCQINFSVDSKKIT